MKSEDQLQTDGQGHALSRNFSIASLLFIVVAAALPGISYQYLATRDLLHLAEDRNVALTHAFSNSLWPRFAGLMTDDSKSLIKKLHAIEQHDGLHTLVSKQMVGTAVIKIKIYSLDGITLFSSDPRQTGEDKRTNPAFLAALAGRVTSGLTHRDTFDAFEGTLSNLDVISTYLPIRDSEGKITAVFEIYSDVTDLTTQLERTRLIIVGTVLAMLGLLYAMQFVLVVRAQGVINRQSAMLHQSIDELDQRVQTRTAALRESNLKLIDEIEERKRVEANLRESTARFRAVTESSNDAIITTDSQGIIIGWNQQAEFFFGYTEDEIAGQPLSTIISERFRADYVRGLQHLTDSQSAHEMGKTIEVEGLRKDHSEFPIELSLASWEVGGRRYVSGTIRDLSERKQSEHHLRIAAVAFETREGVAITDACERILRVNRSFTKITGYCADEVIGLTPRVLSSGRQNKEFYAEMWQKIKDSGSWQGEIWNRRKDGEVYLEWLSITAVKNADGTVSNYVGTFTDITQR